MPPSLLALLAPGTGLVGGQEAGEGIRAYVGAFGALVCVFSILFFYEAESSLRTPVPVNFLGRAWRDRAKPKPSEGLIARGWAGMVCESVAGQSVTGR